MSTKFFWNNKGQVGETVTWIFATVAIVVILLIAIFASSFYFGGKNKYVSGIGSGFPETVSFYSWLLTEDVNNTSIYEQLKTEENLNEFNGELAVNVFEKFYGPDYFDVWTGIFFDVSNSYENNDYFPIRPSQSTGGEYNRGFIPHIKERVILNQNKTVELILASYEKVKLA